MGTDVAGVGDGVVSIAGLLAGRRESGADVRSPLGATGGGGA